jgi:hypothetical protein
MTGLGCDDYRGSAAGDDIPELFEHQRGPEQVDGEDDLRRGLTRRAPAAWMTPVTSPRLAALSASACREAREDMSTAAVLTSKPASSSTSAAASAIGLLQIGEQHMLTGADTTGNRLADLPSSDNNGHIAHH